MGKRKNEKKQKRERDRPNRRERAVAAQAGQGDEEEAQNDDDWGDWKAQRDEEAQGDDQAQDDEDWGDWKAQREEEAQGDDQAQDDEGATTRPRTTKTGATTRRRATWSSPTGLSGSTSMMWKTRIHYQEPHREEWTGRDRATTNTGRALATTRRPGTATGRTTRRPGATGVLSKPRLFLLLGTLALRRPPLGALPRRVLRGPRLLLMLAWPLTAGRLVVHLLTGTASLMWSSARELAALLLLHLVVPGQCPLRLSVTF